MLVSAHFVMFLRTLAGAALCAAVSVATAAPEVFILHSPIQPSSSQAVTYTATASDPDGIASIVISEERRTLGLCDGQKCSIFVATSNIQRCLFTSPYQITQPCTVTTTSAYPDASHIGYRVTATNGTGGTSTEGYVYFAAGVFPWPNDPIPIYVRGDPAAKIDLVFIPDTDYGLNNTGFMDDVTTFVRDAFFSELPFAQEIRNHRAMWNFYITYQQGNAQPGCIRDEPMNWNTLRATVNSGFIVHNQLFRDCSGIGEGSTFSAEPTSLVVSIHELGHSAFSLADEYKGGGLFGSTLPEHNVFNGKTKCKQNAIAHGWPHQNCKIIKRPWWRSDKGADIMKDTSSANNMPGPSGQGRYSWHYNQCVNQNC